jgi:hypothetical protein
MRSSAAIADECSSLPRDGRHGARARPPTPLRLPAALRGLLAAVAALLLLLLLRSSLLLFDGRSLLASQRKASALPPSELHALLEAEGRAEAQAFRLDLPHSSAADETPSPSFISVNLSSGMARDPAMPPPPLVLLFGPAGADLDDLVANFVLEPLLFPAASPHSPGAAAAGDAVCRHDLAAGNDARPGTVDRTSTTTTDVCSRPDGLSMARVGLLVSRELRMRWESRNAGAPSAGNWTGTEHQLRASAGASFTLAKGPNERPHILPYGIRTPFIILLLRDPLEALVAEYNSRPITGRNSTPGEPSPGHAASSLPTFNSRALGGEIAPARYAEPVKRFASEYRRLYAGRNVLACTLAGEPLSTCEPIFKRTRGRGRGRGRQAERGRRGRGRRGRGRARAARATNGSRQSRVGSDGARPPLLPPGICFASPSPSSAPSTVSFDAATAASRRLALAVRGLPPGICLASPLLSAAPSPSHLLRSHSREALRWALPRSSVPPLSLCCAGPALPPHPNRLAVVPPFPRYNSNDTATSSLPPLYFLRRLTPARTHTVSARNRSRSARGPPRTAPSRGTWASNGGARPSHLASRPCAVYRAACASRVAKLGALRRVPRASHWTAIGC